MEEWIKEEAKLLALAALIYAVPLTIYWLTIG